MARYYQKRNTRRTFKSRSNANRRKSTAAVRKIVREVNSMARREGAAIRVPRGIAAAAAGTGSRSESTVSMRYCDSSNITSVLANAAGNYVYACNGLYDSNVSGLGHQPIGFDQYMLFYQHYCVIRAKISVTFWLKDDAATSLIVGISLRDTSAGLSDTTRVREVGNVIWDRLAPSTPGRSITLTRTFDMKKFFGQGADPTDTQYKANVGTNPTDMAFFHLLAMGNDYEATPTVYFSTTLEYTAVLSERKPLTQS